MSIESRLSHALTRLLALGLLLAAATAIPATAQNRPRGRDLIFPTHSSKETKQPSSPPPPPPPKIPFYPLPLSPFIF